MDCNIVQEVGSGMQRVFIVPQLASNMKQNKNFIQRWFEKFLE